MRSTAAILQRPDDTCPIDSPVSALNFASYIPFILPNFVELICCGDCFSGSILPRECDFEPISLQTNLKFSLRRTKLPFLASPHYVILSIFKSGDISKAAMVFWKLSKLPSRLHTSESAMNRLLGTLDCFDDPGCINPFNSTKFFKLGEDNSWGWDYLRLFSVKSMLAYKIHRL